MIRPVHACLAAFLAALPAPILAERGDREKEVVVAADRWTGDDANKTTTFEGNVVVTQGTMRMSASKVTVREDKDRHKVYVANGAPVTFRQKRDNVDEWIEGFAERAEFDDRNDMLKLFTRARVKRNNDEITADQISYDMKKEVAEAVGAPAATKLPGTGRVKVIIQPPKKAPEGSDKAPPVALKPSADAGQQ
jgi:lipopolysaccharide export system protein LptA